MNNKISCLFAWLMIIFCGASGVFAAGVPVDDETLRVTFPYVEYGGVRYHAVLDYAGSQGDDLYWKFTSITPTTATGSCGGTVAANLNITNACVLLQGREYKVNLLFTPNFSGQQGLFWRLDNQIQPLDCIITQVKGGDLECYDMAWMIQTQQCLSQCSPVDSECALRCMGASLFKLAVEYTNTAPSDQTCALPAGMIFRAKDTSIQNMLLTQTQVFQIPAGASKTVCIPTYCLNSERHGPDETSLYATAGGATSPCMVEIINGVQGKRIDSGAELQDMVWDCANDGAISGDQRAYLRNLPVAN
jgi:hypothetical protein